MKEPKASDIINVEDIMEELRTQAASRKYAKEAPDFETVMEAEELPPRPFHLGMLRREVQAFQKNCQVEYDIPVSGKGAGVKRWIRKLYRFHLKPLFDSQNDVNLGARIVFGRLEDFAVQAQTQLAQSREELKRTEAQLAQLQASLEQSESRMEQMFARQQEMQAQIEMLQKQLGQR